MEGLARITGIIYWLYEHHEAFYNYLIISSKPIYKAQLSVGNYESHYFLVYLTKIQVPDKKTAKLINNFQYLLKASKEELKQLHRDVILSSKISDGKFHILADLFRKTNSQILYNINRINNKEVELELIIKII